MAVVPACPTGGGYWAIKLLKKRIVKNKNRVNEERNELSVLVEQKDIK